MWNIANSLICVSVWFWIGLLRASPSLHQISASYIWQAGGRTLGLLLISGSEIGSSRFPWLLLWIWQPFFHSLSTRGMLTPVFLVTVWNWRNSERGNLSRSVWGGWSVLVYFACACVLCVCINHQTALHDGTNKRNNKALEMSDEISPPCCIQVPMFIPALNIEHPIRSNISGLHRGRRHRDISGHWNNFLSWIAMDEMLLLL